MQDVRKSIICLKNLENGANSFNLSTNGAPKLISNALLLSLINIVSKNVNQQLLCSSDKLRFS
ncbi:hypothetical protein T06_13083 [Trichinella sp. T6]|nr:hypothetical protein T06_13083 [Trichinella sp. T6]